MASQTEGKVIGDIVKYEEPFKYSRDDLLVDASQTLVRGQAVAFGVGDRIKAIGANVNEVQLISITGTLSAGSYRLGFPGPDGTVEWTGLIAFGAANNAAIQTAVDLIPNGSHYVVGGTLRTAQTFTFSGASVAGQTWPLIQLDMGELTGLEDSTVERTTAGGKVVASTDEVQTLTLDGTATGGTYTLTIPHPNGTTFTTIPIADSDNAAAILTDINTALAAATPVIPAGSITVGGTTLDDDDITLTFSGEVYEGRDWPLVTVDVTLLTGTAIVAATAAETTKGSGFGEVGGGEAVGIVLNDVTTAGGVLTTKEAVLVRNAIVDVDQMTFGVNANKVDVIAQLKKVGIVVRKEPSAT